MENKIRQHIEALFAAAPDTAKTKEVREDMIVNVIERYHDYIAQGKSPEEAYRASVAGIGDVSELIASLRHDADANASAHRAQPETPPVYTAPQQSSAPASGKKGLSTGAIVAIVICSTILLLTLIGGFIAIRVTGAIFSGDGALANLFGWVSVNNLSDSSSASFDFNDDDGFDNAYADASSYSVACDGVNTLNIYWISGSVSIQPAPADTNDITFSETSASGISSQTALRYRLTDSALTIRCCSADIWKRLDWSDIAHSAVLPSKALTVYIPQSILESMKITVGSVSNTIEISDVSVDEINIDTVSGDCTLSGVQADSFIFNGVSCNVLLRACNGASVKCSLVSGDTELEGAFDQCKLNSVSGDVVLTFASAPSNVDIGTVSGSITMHGCSAFGFTADFDTVSGDVDSGLAMSRNDQRYIYGDGKAKLDLETVSGDLGID